VYVINRFVHIFGHTCIFSYFLWMFAAGTVTSLWCCVEWFRDARSIVVNQYLLVLWFAMWGLINVPLCVTFSDVAAWSTDEQLKYMPGDPGDWAGECICVVLWKRAK
jgi:hypothetical protein